MCLIVNKASFGFESLDGSGVLVCFCPLLELQVTAVLSVRKALAAAPGNVLLICFSVDFEQTLHWFRQSWCLVGALFQFSRLRVQCNTVGSVQ